MIKKSLGIDPVLKSGRYGQFEVIVDGEKIAERSGNFLIRLLGAGYPDRKKVVEQLEKRQAKA